MSGYEDIDPSVLGPNMWLIDEMYRSYREDPEGVSDAWKEFFEGFHPALEERASTTGETAESLRVASVEPRSEKAGPTVAPEQSVQAPEPRSKTLPPGAERLRF